MRWAAVEAATGRYRSAELRADYTRIAERRGKRKAQLAVARKVLTLVYYGLRDGHIRALDHQAA